jgi:hypothetical protein
MSRKNKLKKILFLFLFWVVVAGWKNKIKKFGFWFSIS